MPLAGSGKIKKDIEELGKACVIAGKRATDLGRKVPEVIKETNDAAAAFDSAFRSLRLAFAKVQALEKEVEVEDQNQG